MILEFLKEYWFLITFAGGLAVAFFTFSMAMIQATKCSLRNDILAVYDRCKDKKQITKYQLESINHSADIYFLMKGNSFVKDILERVKKFEIVD